MKLRSVDTIHGRLIWSIILLVYIKDINILDIQMSAAFLGIALQFNLSSPSRKTMMDNGHGYVKLNTH